MKVKVEMTLVKTKPTKDKPNGGYAAKLKPNFSPDYKNIEGESILDITCAIKDILTEADARGLITEK